MSYDQVTTRQCARPGCNKHLGPRNLSGVCRSCLDKPTGNSSIRSYPTKRETVDERTLSGVHFDRFSWLLAKGTEKGLTSYAIAGFDAANVMAKQAINKSPDVAMEML